MKKISRNSEENLKDELDIVKIVSHYVNDLKQSGANYKCKSPFVDENTPSFVVSPKKGIFKCFSSGIGGDSIKFIRTKEPSLTYFEALQKAADIMNFTLEYEEFSKEDHEILEKRTALFDLLSKAQDLFLKEFSKLPEKHWVNKMISDRKISEDSISNFLLGYAPKTSSKITEYAIEKGLLGESKELGLSKSRQGSAEDNFKNRLIFPIINEKGLVVGFGGRASNEPEDLNENGKHKYGKYINSDESEVYKKDRILYGLFQAKNEIIEKNVAILVEGYIDVISLHQNGIGTAVASCGTAFSISQAKKLKKYCNHVIIWRDGDEAGKKAIKNDLSVLLSLDFKVSLIVDEAGADPDEICQREDDLQKYIDDNKQDALSYHAKLLLEDSISENYDRNIEKFKEEKLQKIEELNKQYEPELNQLSEKFEENSADYKREKRAIEKLLKDKLKLILDDYSLKVKNLSKYDPYRIAGSVQELAILLAKITNQPVLDDYTKNFTKLFNQEKKYFADEIAKAKEKNKNKVEKFQEKTASMNGFPKGGDQEQADKDGFAMVGNSIWFQDSKSRWFKGMDFTLNPLFHIDGRDDNKRLCEVISESGIKNLVDFDSKDLLNFPRFQDVLFERDNFICDSQMSTTHHRILVKKIASDFIKAKELTILGWQTKGFFAYANGIDQNNSFKEVNKYGIIQIDDLDDKSEFAENHKHFYSPAYFQGNNNDKDDSGDIYENDRYLAKKDSPISLKEWMQLFIDVYGKKHGSIALSYIFSTCIRSHIVGCGYNMPLLGCFGEKGSGKSKFSASISSFFFNDMPYFSLQNGTIAGFTKRLERVRDVVAYCDEYNDDIMPVMWQTMKNSFDNNGREKSQRREDNRTKISKSNASIVYAGQYLPQVDEGSLIERTIVLQFIKVDEDKRTDLEKERFARLTEIQKQGINSLIMDIMKHRTALTSRYNKEIQEIQSSMRNALKGQDYTSRILDNYSILLTTISLIKDKIDLPFDFKYFYELCLDEVMNQADLVSDVGGMMEFWTTFQSLFSDGFIREDYQFKIEKTHEVKGYKKVKGVKQVDAWINSNEDEILYFSFSNIHKKISKELIKEGKKPIGENTLRNYFKSKKYFIKSAISGRIGERNMSLYAFNYTMLNKMGILFLKNFDDKFSQEMDWVSDEENNEKDSLL